jgi:hypothetical protein
LLIPFSAPGCATHCRSPHSQQSLASTSHRPSRLSPTSHHAPRTPPSITRFTTVWFSPRSRHALQSPLHPIVTSVQNPDEPRPLAPRRAAHVRHLRSPCRRIDHRGTPQPHVAPRMPNTSNPTSPNSSHHSLKFALAPRRAAHRRHLPTGLPPTPADDTAPYHGPTRIDSRIPTFHHPITPERKQKYASAYFALEDFGDEFAVLAVRANRFWIAVRLRLVALSLQVKSHQWPIINVRSPASE